MKVRTILFTLLVIASSISAKSLTKKNVDSEGESVLASYLITHSKSNATISVHSQLSQFERDTIYSRAAYDFFFGLKDFSTGDKSQFIFYLQQYMNRHLEAISKYNKAKLNFQRDVAEIVHNDLVWAEIELHSRLTLIEHRELDDTIKAYDSLSKQPVQ